MCHLFLQVAKLYVEAKSNEAYPPTTTPNSAQRDQNEFYPQEPVINLDTMTQFDPYLSALGLMPNAGFSMTAFLAAHTNSNVDGFASGSFDANMAPGGSGSGPGNATTVHDWFSGSRYLLNLMEDDIHMPDLNL